MAPRIKLYATANGVVHWSYPMAGLLTVCGRLGAEDGDRPFPGADEVPTCVTCVVTVSKDLQGELFFLESRLGDPTRKLG